MKEKKERNEEKVLKFGRDARFVFSSRDVYIERYVDSVDKKTGETRKRWKAVTGYYGSLRMLLNNFVEDEFRRKPVIKELESLLAEVKDAVEKLPNYLILSNEKTPVIIQKEIVYKTKVVEVEKVKRKYNKKKTGSKAKKAVGKEAELF